MKKSLFLMILLLCAALLLSGCSSNADANPTGSPGTGNDGVFPGMSPNVSPGASPGMLPGDNDSLSPLGTGAPGDEGQAVSRIESAQDALTASKALRDAVGKLTEVDTSAAVALGDTALVGIKYDTSYRAGTDERMRGMVLARAKAVHPAITRVAITDKEDEVAKISSLYQMLQNGSPYTTVKANADSLAAGMDMVE